MNGTDFDPLWLLLLLLLVLYYFLNGTTISAVFSMIIPFVFFLPFFLSFFFPQFLIATARRFSYYVNIIIAFLETKGGGDSQDELLVR